MTNDKAHATIDHEEIRQWVTERDGRPATVIDPENQGEDGILRIDFGPVNSDPDLQEISWTEFFNIFEENNLAFLYQDELESGEDSRFNQFVSRDTVEVDTQE